jgi:hypothetical protein
MTTVAAFVPDLMDRSKVAGAAGPATEVTFVRSAAELAGLGADLAVVDLSRPGAVDALPALAEAGVRTVGFASHVDRELMEAALAAGCEQVLPRSRFFATLSELLG